MTLTEFLHCVHRILPPASAMAGDPIGTQIASSAGSVSKVLTCMEITDAVIDEACAQSCDTIVTFHPLIYVPLKAIAGQDRVARLTARLIRSDISVVCVHTTFDAHRNGTNAILAQKLGLSVLGPLEHSPAGEAGSQDATFGIGLVASCHLSFNELLEQVHSVCGGPLRYCEPKNSAIAKVAIVAGSGMSLYKNAVDSGADVFITADVKYHDFHAATSTIGIIDPGHYEMEQFVPEGMRQALASVCSSCTFIASSVSTSPVRHYLPTQAIRS